LKEKEMDKTSDDWLFGWKDIGNYLGCSYKTAQMYFKNHGLPVKRTPSKCYFKVSAKPSEIDKWREKVKIS